MRVFQSGSNHSSCSDSGSSIPLHSTVNARFEVARLLIMVCMLVDLLTMVIAGAAMRGADGSHRHMVPRWSRPLRALMPVLATSELRRCR